MKQSTAIVIQVKVKPSSRTSAFEPAEGGIWVARIRSAPVNGKANEELIALVAEHFQCRKSAVSIKSGAAGRMKVVRIEAAWTLRVSASRTLTLHSANRLQLLSLATCREQCRNRQKLMSG